MQQRLVPRAAENQQVLVGELVDLVGVGHGHAGDGIAGRRAHPAHLEQVQAVIGRIRVVRQDHGGFGQIGHPRKREAAIGERGQIGQRHVVRERRQVDGRVRIDRAHDVIEQAAVAFAGVRNVVVEMEAQLCPRREQQRRDMHGAARLSALVRQDGAEIAAEVEHRRRLGRNRQRLHEAVVDADVQRRAVRRRAHGIAIAQIDRRALGVPHEEIGRHAQIHAHGVRIVAGDAQIARLSQLAEAHRAVGGQPVRCVVRHARAEFVELRDRRAFAGEHALADAERFRGGLQFGFVAPEHQQQFAAHGRFAVHHRKGGA
ncbi:hypothetical protein [Paraburkholderia sp. GAS41]|uniref:hypothetical protein n=1 Tax=Paraburkholderia sp. GAS41 TaxID=3035134 RepID=UPI003D1D50A6